MFALQRVMVRVFRDAPLRLAAVIVLVAMVVLACLPAPSQAALHSKYFWVLGRAGLQHFACALQGSSHRADVYTCGGARIGREQTRDLLSAYEHHILPTDLRVFGTPRHLGRTEIVLTQLDSSSLGYFDENDIMPTDEAHSNHANVLYIRPPSLMPDGNGEVNVQEVVAHELQHLINFRIRVIDRHLPPQAPWLNEGLAFYAQIVNGFWTRRDTLKVEAAAGQPSWPVDGLRENNEFLYRHARVAYGRAGLFMVDLARRHGPYFARSVITAPGSGLSAVNYALGRSHPSTTVQAAFAQWGVDLLQNGMGTGFWQGRVSARPIPQALALPAINVPDPGDSPWQSSSLRLHSWAQDYLQFRSAVAGSLRISVSAANGPLQAAVVAVSTKNLAAPSVIWCRPNGRDLQAQIDNFGALYDRATLVVSSTPRMGASVKDAPFRVSAGLIYMSNHNRAARPTSSAGKYAHISIRKPVHFD